MCSRSSGRISRSMKSSSSARYRWISSGIEKSIAHPPLAGEPLYRSCGAGPGGRRCRAMEPLVETALGPVRGIEQDGARRFLGIPYAAPPVGILRFSAPAPHPGWTEPLDAFAFGPAPIQPADGLSQTLGLLGQHAQSEDCLALNVFTPAAPAATLRPVLVWLHG